MRRFPSAAEEKEALQTQSQPPGAGFDGSDYVYQTLRRKGSGLPLTDVKFTGSQALFNLVNGVLGVGVLGYPFSFKECGILLGTVVVLACLSVCLFSVRLLLLSSQICGQRSFEEVAAASLGQPGKNAVNLCILSLNLGAVVAYLNIVADVLSSVAGSVIPPGAEPSRHLLIVGVTVLGALPIALAVRDGKALATVSTLSVGIIFVFAFSLLSWGVTPRSDTGSPLVWQPKGLLVAFPIMAYGFTMHPILFPVYSLLHSPSTQKMTSIVTKAMVVCAVVYIAVGIGGYMTFSSRTAGDILRNLGPINGRGLMVGYERMLKTLYGLSLLATIPLVILPMQNIVLPFLSSCAADAVAQPSCNLATRKRVIVLGLVGCALAVALLVPNVEFILGLSGATSSVMLVYILPACIYLNLSAKDTKTSTAPFSHETSHSSEHGRKERWKAGLLLAFGLFVGFACTRATLLALQQEKVVVQLVQDLVQTGKAVEDASKAEQIAKDAVKTVELVESAAKELNDVQGDAAASLEAIQQTAEMLNASIESPASTKAVPLWDVEAKVNAIHDARKEREALGTVMENLVAVQSHVSTMITAVEGIYDRLQNAMVDAGTDTEAGRTSREGINTGAFTEELVNEHAILLASELATAVGKIFEPEEGRSADVSLDVVRQDVDDVLAALHESLNILTQVGEAVQEARSRGRTDEKLKTDAAEAMRRAINATTVSALAIDLTVEGLQKVASNQTSELIQLLRKGGTDQHIDQTAQEAQVAEEDTWKMAASGNGYAQGNGKVGLDGGTDVNGAKHASNLISGGQSQSAGDKTEKMDARAQTQGAAGDSGTLNAVVARGSDVQPEKVQQIIQQLEDVANSTSSPSGPLNVSAVSALAEAAQAALDVAVSTKQEAMHDMKEKVDQAEPEVATRVEEIAKELEVRDGTSNEEEEEDGELTSSRVDALSSTAIEDSNTSHNESSLSIGKGAVDGGEGQGKSTITRTANGTKQKSGRRAAAGKRADREVT